jgi:hypothetical protein
MIDFSEYESQQNICCESCNDEGCGCFADVQSQAVGEARWSTCECDCQTAQDRRALEESEQETITAYSSESVE